MNRIRKILSVYMAAAIAMTALSGCSVGSKSSDEVFGLYYLDGKQGGIIKTQYSLSAAYPQGQLDEIFDIYSKKPKDDSCISPISDETGIPDYELDDTEALLDFTSEYLELAPSKEALVRCALARTILQLDGVDQVTFTVEGEPLKDSSGYLVGSMNKDSVLDSFGENEEALESDTFTLYYATEDGKNLIKETQVLHYSNTMSRESVVLSFLAKNPTTRDGAKAVLSPSTKVISVATKEGVCIVKLDASFLSQSTNVATMTAVYAIVNSLTQLDDITKVEIEVDGMADSLVPDSDMAQGVYEADESLVITEEQQED